MNDSDVNKAWIWHQEVAKISKMQEYWSLRGQNHVLCHFIGNMRFRGSKFHQSWVQISYDGLENNFNDYHANKAWIWHQEVAKMHQMQGNWSLWGLKSGFMIFYPKYEI